MEIREVLTSKEIKTFVRFPNHLYRHCQYYVPPLESSEIKIITQHPAKEFCDMRMWIAYQDNTIVGRIAGIINHKCNSLKQQRRIRFGWFDVINDLDVARALFAEVEKWACSQNLDEISGPSRFSNMDKQSMLISGFDLTPPITADYNFPYYPLLMEQLGFVKEVDYIQYRINVTEVPDNLKLVSQKLVNKYDVHLKKIKNKKELKKIGIDIFSILNLSYHSIYNFIPLSDKEIQWMLKDLYFVANKDLISLIEDSAGQLVGISFCLPSLSRAYQKAKGHLFPLGWYYILKALKKNTTADLYITGVLPEWIHTGIHVLYHVHLNEVFLEKGFRDAFTTQQLEDNTACRIWNKYDAEPCFKRRCYVKKLNTQNN